MLISTIRRPRTRPRERVDHLALRGQVRVRQGSPRTRRRARLASWVAVTGERPTIRAILSNGTPNMPR
jgi:hypothetical protein